MRAAANIAKLPDLLRRKDCVDSF
jgi:hypothetical protein